VHYSDEVLRFLHMGEEVPHSFELLEVEVCHSQDNAYTAGEFISTLTIAEARQFEEGKSIMGTRRRKQDMPCQVVLQESVEDKGVSYSRMFVFCWTESVTVRFYVSI
jgi:hypothetical protein